ncbi:MAG: DUF1549 domain-containing protein [Phycisphaerales bacterium]|nr:DUF1549 domain-containing protein [Phycisphaerales bacterium]
MRHIAFMLLSISTLFAATSLIPRPDTAVTSPISPVGLPQADSTAIPPSESPRSTDSAEPAASPADHISFNKQIRPILSDRCFRCHGPDSAARKADLRLDSFDGATADLGAGFGAITPGDPDDSELVARINSNDPDDVMPPPESKLSLSPDERDLLREWIKQGATYEPHWAFVAPKPVAPPSVKDQSWPRDPLDRFVLATLESKGWTPSRAADKAALLRRASLVLTGLPPAPDETSAFIADTSANAYETRVDAMLASPRFGERLAADWLDAARFADTFGYQSDWECRVWPWRDWLINAFNSNMPYDRFITEQIAGDLLPNATQQQKLATTFNRLHRQTNEGGSIDEEFRQEYVADRVRTFGTAFLGLTLECSRCHDHKYDPITQDDYYSLGSFFSTIDEAGTYPYATSATPRPAMRLASPEQTASLADLRAKVKDAEVALTAAQTDAAKRAVRSAIDAVFDEQQQPASTPATLKLTPPEPAKRWPLEGTADSPAGKATLFDGDVGATFNDSPEFRRCDPISLSLWINCPDEKSRAVILHTSYFTLETDPQGYQLLIRDGRLCWEIVHMWPGSAAAIQTSGTFPIARWVHVVATYDGSSRASGLHLYFDGQPAATETTRDHLDGPTPRRTLQVAFRDRDVGFKNGSLADLQLFTSELSPLDALELFRPGSIRSLAEGLSRISRGEPEDRPPAELGPWFAQRDAACIAARETLRDARRAEQDLLESIPEIMVMETAPFERQNYVLSRGRYDAPDHDRPVRADRAIKGIMEFGDRPHDRLGLASWTTDPANPLTARVAVNRLWSLCFGVGLIPTLENLGQQGELPVHQELLDSLASDFVASGWNVKSLMRRIVLSSTFRQSSDHREGIDDHANAFLSRGPSVRLSAEMIRDQALLASGLLVEKIGGPSVKPWQPPGIWEDSGANVQSAYVPDTGDNAHRRSIYTFRKRTAPPPNMLVFDAGSREECLARRQPTTTPLQPLVIWNDPVFFECARAAAAIAQRETTPAAQCAALFNRFAAREPRPDELAALVDLLNEQANSFASDTASAAALLGLKPDSAEKPSPQVQAERAALSVVASTIMASDASVVMR